MPVVSRINVSNKAVADCRNLMVKIKVVNYSEVSLRIISKFKNVQFQFVQDSLVKQLLVRNDVKLLSLFTFGQLYVAFRQALISERAIGLNKFPFVDCPDILKPLFRHSPVINLHCRYVENVLRQEIVNVTPLPQRRRPRGGRKRTRPRRKAIL
jgi:hypothetical protein